MSNFYYRTTQLLYNLMNVILIPLGITYFILGILTMFEIMPAINAIRYAMLIILFVYSIVVILFFLGVCTISIPRNELDYTSPIYSLGLYIFNIKCKFDTGFLYFLRTLWYWFIAPFALIVTCKLLNILQDNWFMIGYYVIYLIALVISDDSNTENYNVY